MNSVIEKEKKLNLALAKLKNLNLKNPDVKKNKLQKKCSLFIWLRGIRFIK